MVRGIGDCCCGSGDQPDTGCSQPEVFNYPFSASLSGSLQTYENNLLPTTVEAWWQDYDQPSKLDAANAQISGSGGNFTFSQYFSNFLGNDSTFSIGKPINANRYSNAAVDVTWVSQLTKSNLLIGTDSIGVGFLPFSGSGPGTLAWPGEPALLARHEYDAELDQYKVALPDWLGTETSPGIGAVCGSTVTIRLKVTPFTDPPDAQPVFGSVESFWGEGPEDTCFIFKGYTVLLEVDGVQAANEQVFFWTSDGTTTFPTEFRTRTASVDGQNFIVVVSRLRAPVFPTDVTQGTVNLTNLTIT